MNKHVKIVKKLEYTDGNDEVYQLTNAIVIDLTGNERLEDLLKEALVLESASKIKVDACSFVIRGRKLQ